MRCNPGSVCKVHSLRTLGFELQGVDEEYDAASGAIREAEEALNSYLKKVSRSWIRIDASIRNRCGALFCDALRCAKLAPHHHPLSTHPSNTCHTLAGAVPALRHTIYC